MDYPILSREDSVIFDGWGYDYNSAEMTVKVPEYAVPDAFCDEAKAMMADWGAGAHIVEYCRALVLTNGSRILTYYGDGSFGNPCRGPRGVFETWEELERFLVDSYLETHGMV